ncbi:lanthionine synthetase LanC family protein [Streptomyces aureus]|uniref:class III lanthionine synthetase LanKC N-terminal domain-containing protein n=1 Tax=Streptomyces aureus TaxID=193461 RepID=UPI000A840EDE|nr:lanthionine synthetase LanC family protein [Streptomyces aureus]
MSIVPGEQLHTHYRRALDGFMGGLPAGWRTRLRRDSTITWQVCEFADALPSQGWKLHITTSAAGAVGLFEKVLPELVEAKTTFKLPADVGAIIQINAGVAGKSQVGKIVTAYPASDKLLATLIDRIDAIWRPSHAPSVTSDLPVASGGALSIRYGAFVAKEVVTDSFGVTHSALQAPDGRLQADVRDSHGRQPDWAVPPVKPADRNLNVQPGAPVRIDGITYLPLKALTANLRGHVALAVRLSDRRLVIIRHRVRGIEGDEFGNDAVTRLENERQVLRRLSSSGIAPELIAHDPLTGHLVISDAGGTQPEKLPPVDRVRCLHELAATVAELHAQGVVHRDLKMSNVRMGSEGLRLIDFEMAATIGTARPVPGGTDGYEPPEGRRAIVDPSYDIYSLGSCVTHAATGYCPGRLPQQSNAGRQIGLLQQRGQQTAASIVKACHDPAPRRRPTAGQVAKRLRAALPALETESLTTPASHHTAFDRRWALSSAVSAGLATRGFKVVRGGHHHWRNSHLLAAYECEGLNLGAAGIILALATLDTASGSRHFDSDITGGAEWLAARPSLEQAHGLFTGNSGVAVALALAGARLERPDLIEAARRRFEGAARSRISDYDLFSGAAGIVWAGVLIDAILGTSWGCDLAEQQTMRVHATARKVDGIIGWTPHPQFDAAGRIYLGAAHGTAGIAMALAVWAGASGCVNTSTLAADALHSITEHGLTTDRSNILATMSGEVRTPHHWCHGIAGLLWCLLQTPTSYDTIDTQIVSAFDRATPDLDNPTLCHGLAGVMETWRMLKALPEHRDGARRRASELAASLRLLHHSRDGATVWSSERPSLVTPDLWVGFLGPATQLALAAAGSNQAMLSPQWLQRCSVPLATARSRSNQFSLNPA